MDFDLFLLHLSFHSRRPNKCTECGWRLSSDPLEVDRHWKDHHELLHLNSPSHSKCSEVKVDFSNMKEELWECSECPVTFSSETELHQHEICLQHDSNKNFNCSEAGCSKSYASIENLRVHRALSHPELVGLSCFYCDKSVAVTTAEGKVIFDLKFFLKHCKEFHSGKSPIEECRHCGAAFYKRCDYVSHMVTKHSEGQLKCFWCPVCFSRYSTSDALKFHIQTLHVASQVTCELCGQQLRDARRLNNHKFQAHGVLEEGSKMFRCEESGCDYETLLASNLRVHKRKKHPADARKRPYSCQYCGKGFFQKSHLDNHEKTHNPASKPYQCDICGSSFAVTNYLYIHNRLCHDGLKFPSTNKKKPRIKKKQ